MTGARPLRLALAAFACVALGGCISLFPKTKPAQMYQFDNAPAAADAGLPAAEARVIARGDMRFEAAAASDRILTVTGTENAYIAEARWVSPAPVLFEQSLIRAFETGGGPRLAEGGSGVHATEILNLDVQSFETRYDNGDKAAPEVVVQMRAQLVRADDRRVIADQMFTSIQRASDNRVGAIVQAYDAAVHDVLGKLAGWTAQRG
ncbi:MAG TPA: ABC-type transport auxiliary lipoprotein family protein [Caulobacteraceae bacterium]|nr:ABC-type transport auxiliary lipoprotein family protein [Caulobacteraceae bacterium]